jgi:beta-lactamase superfamily II metal-dependent hydrolase
LVKTKLKILKAHHGDAIIIETYDFEKNKFIILIDGGPNQTFKTALVPQLAKYKKIDLIILTHIDHDHIGGLLQYFLSSHGKKHQIDKLLINSPNLKKVRSNGTQISMGEGMELEKLIFEKYPNIEVISNITSDNEMNLNLPKGINIKILSPNDKARDELISNWPEIDLKKNDNIQVSSEQIISKYFDIDFTELAKKEVPEKKIKRDFANASSIAFALKTNDFHGLFLGDSHASIVTESIISKYSAIPVKYDIVKLSHHGSKYNISNEFLDTIQSEKFIISTNGGQGKSKHPDRQTIAKVVCHKNMQDGKNLFYFNYPLSTIERKTGKLFKPEEVKLFNYQEINEIIL